MAYNLHRKCSKCGIIRADDKSVTYFQFPLPGKNNIEKAKAWSIFCWPEEDYTNVKWLTSLHKKSKFLCGRHFDESCFLDSRKTKMGKFSCPGSKQYVRELLNRLRKEARLLESQGADSVAGPSWRLDSAELRNATATRQEKDSDLAKGPVLTLFSKNATATGQEKDSDLATGPVLTLFSKNATATGQEKDSDLAKGPVLTLFSKNATETGQEKDSDLAKGPVLTLFSKNATATRQEKDSDLAKGPVLTLFSKNATATRQEKDSDLATGPVLTLFSKNATATGQEKDSDLAKGPVLTLFSKNATATRQEKDSDLAKGPVLTLFSKNATATGQEKDSDLAKGPVLTLFSKNATATRQEKDSDLATGPVLTLFSKNATATGQEKDSDLATGPVLTLFSENATATNMSRSKNKIRGPTLKSLNVQRLSQLSSKERKIYGYCQKAFKEIGRLRRNLKAKKSANKVEKFCQNEHIKKLANMNISNSFISLIESQIRNCPKKPQGRRYNLEDKILALGIYKKSPAAYRLLRRFIALPSQSTLIKLLNRVPLRPGINPQIFNGIKSMADAQTEEENLCVLLFDEMAIKPFLDYNKRLDMVEGYQDHGGEHGRDNQVASNALVFMACGIRKRWKQPVAYYLSGKSVTADRLHVLIKEVLTECFKAGISVLGTICDMASVNIKALTNLGATSEKPYFIHEGNEIATIADPPHLLKCTRNMFLAHDIKCDLEMQSEGRVMKGTAKWQHVRDFFECDQTNPHFVFAPALSESHINPNTKQKMRVKLAAQVLSHSVTAGILAKVSTGELPSEAIATTTITKKFDQLFDALNADSPDARRGKICSTNITPRSPHLRLFAEMKKFIKGMTFEGSLRVPPSQPGWIMTINAVERLWRNLNRLGIHSLATRRLNQDPLENLFGCIRYNSGSNYNPTVSQFIAGIKTAIVSNLRNSSNRKNCEDDTAELVDNLKAFLSIPSSAENRHNILGETEVDIVDTVEAVSEKDLLSSEIQACAYVCGFILKNMRNQECESCKKALIAQDNNELIHIFTSFKEYGPNPSLKYVSIALVDAVETSTTILNKVFDCLLWKKNIKTVAISALENVDFSFLNNCQEHASENANFIKKSVFHITVKRNILKKNRQLAEADSKKKLARKFNILKNR